MSTHDTLWWKKLHGWRGIVQRLRERIARRLFVWAYKIGGPAEFERSKEHVRVIPGASQVEQAAVRQRELLDMIEKAKDEGRLGHEPF